MLMQVANAAGGRFDPPHYPIKTLPYIMGKKMQVPNNIVLELEESFVLPFDAELVSVAVSCSEYHDDDNWEVYVDDIAIAETIFTKGLPEGIYLMAMVPVPTGTEIRIVFKNDSGGGPKHIWWDLQFLRSEPSVV